MNHEPFFGLLRTLTTTSHGIGEQGKSVECFGIWYLPKPSHSFFTHLVNVLNPADYLAPVAMLLAEKSANRVARQDYAEAQTSLALPLSVMQHYDGIVKLNVGLRTLVDVDIQHLANFS